MYGAVLVALSALTCADALIIPEELPTLLSVIYSNIPPIKLGFDTRFGFGFRIGPHADFQTIIELGPQENTRPIGTDNNTVAKRQSQKREDLERIPAPKKLIPENNDVDEKEDESIRPSLADIILGRKGKKQTKQFFDEIEFKKVPGVDDLKKSPKTGKLKREKSPTKTLIFR